MREIKSLRDKALDFLEEQKSSQYTLELDEDYNLTIRFYDGEAFHLPVVPFRPYQKEAKKVLFSDQSKRLMLEWPRRAGKEVFTWQTIIQAAVMKEGMYIMAYPTNVRARKILWQGAALIKGISVRFLDMIPRRLLSKKPNDAEMTIELINGSIIWVVGCDIDPDKLRGTNPLGLVLSEFAFSDPRIFYNMLPVFRQNGGWVIGQSTYDGMNHFYWLIKKNMDNPLWFCREESIRTLVDENGNPYITDADVEEDRQAGMAEYLIQQEYYGNVQVNQETKYFAIAMNAVHESERIIPNLILPRANAYAFYDIGVNDCTAITIAQFEMKGSQLWANVIGYIESNNHDLNYYVMKIRQFCNRHNIAFAGHFIPHDGKNRNFNDGLKNTIDYLSEMGERGQFVKRPSTHKVAIESIRRQLYFTNFNAENCVRLIDCLCAYEKEYDEDLATYKSTPNHDWSSHGVKSYQTMALAIEAKLVNLQSYEVHYYNQ